jgi:hypothetical protein
LNQDAITVSIKPENVAQAVWKKLGITQAFDLLLVKACLQESGTPSDLCTRVASTLTEGAQKFWEMSFQELIRNMKRQEILDVQEDLLVVHAQFLEKLTRAMETFSSGNSRVAPSAGVSLESLEARTKARALRAEREKERKKAEKAAKSAKTPARRAQIRPSKRAATIETADPLGQETVAPVVREPKPMPTDAPAEPREAMIKKTFTSIRLNRLFDRLEHSTLSIKQLSEKLDLGSSQVDQFLSVCASADLIRIVRTDLIELQWRGREYARTMDAERRMGVLSLVKELRSTAQESNHTS